MSCDTQLLIKITVIEVYASRLYIHFYFCHKGRVTTTACANYCKPILPRCVDFSEGGKPEYSEKNPRSTGEINYGNSIHMKCHTRLGFSSERHALTACINLVFQVSMECKRIYNAKLTCKEQTVCFSDNYCTISFVTAL